MEHSSGADETPFIRPTFLGIGAPKAGTTSLYQYLHLHPDFRPAARKEVDFFQGWYDRGQAWYWAQFPRSEPGKVLVTGEFSVNYYDVPGVPQRVADVLPEARLILLLRNPIARAYSHYIMDMRRVPSPPFEDLVERELKRLEIAGTHWIERLADPLPSLATAKVTRGLYAQAIRRWLEVFPREQMLIIKSEALFADPAYWTAQTLKFIGLDPARYPSDAAYQVEFPGEYNTTMHPQTREKLKAFYRPHNEELAQLLNWDVSDWDE